MKKQKTAGIVCCECGCRLDPGERCSCEKDAAERRTAEQIAKTRRIIERNIRMMEQAAIEFDYS